MLLSNAYSRVPAHTFWVGILTLIIFLDICMLLKLRETLSCLLADSAFQLESPNSQRTMNGKINTIIRPIWWESNIMWSLIYAHWIFITNWWPEKIASSQSRFVGGQISPVRLLVTRVKMGSHANCCSGWYKVERDNSHIVHQSPFNPEAETTFCTTEWNA